MDDWLDDLDLTLIRIAEDYVNALSQQQVPSSSTPSSSSSSSIVKREVIEIDNDEKLFDTPILPARPWKRRRLQINRVPKRKREEDTIHEEGEEAVTTTTQEVAIAPAIIPKEASTRNKPLILRFTLPRPYGHPILPKLRTPTYVFIHPRYSLQGELVLTGTPLCPPKMPWGWTRCYEVEEPYARTLSSERLQVALKFEEGAKGKKLSKGHYAYLMKRQKERLKELMSKKEEVPRKKPEVVVDDEGSRWVGVPVRFVGNRSYVDVSKWPLPLVRCTRIRI